MTLPLEAYHGWHRQFGSHLGDQTRLKSILLLIPYFGCWPAWMDAFVLSCRYNPGITWHFFTDCGPILDAPTNVGQTHITWKDYQALVSNRLGIRFHHENPYKCCDLRPFLARIHATEIKGFDFWGYGDIDVIYGSISHFYDDAVLRNDVVTTHEDRIAGHLTLVRNAARTNNLYRLIPSWRKLLEHGFHAIDETHWSDLLLGKKRRWIRRLLGVRVCAKEQFSTVLAQEIPWNRDPAQTYPDRWLWTPAGLFVDDLGQRKEMLYLHFMNWANHRYLRTKKGMAGPGENAWATLPHVFSAGAPRDGDSFWISPDGIERIQA